jgi:hypothetical protein
MSPEAANCRIDRIRAARERGSRRKASASKADSRPVFPRGSSIRLAAAIAAKGSPASGEDANARLALATSNSL